MRPLEKLVSLVLVGVICGGLTYAHNRESLVKQMWVWFFSKSTDVTGLN